MTIPTFLTTLRIALVPVLILVYFLPSSWRYWGAAGVFVAACITDWLDGYMARYLQQVSRFGAFLDPVADKLIVVVALMLIVENSHLPYMAVLASIIVSREIAVSALREWMSEMGKRQSVAVSQIGKIKSTMQMTALGILLAYDPTGPLWLGQVGYVLLLVACVLTIGSMVYYMRMAWSDLSLH